MNHRFIYLLMAGTVLCSCIKVKKPSLHIEGFVARDNFGNPLGNIGTVGDDWEVDQYASLSAREQSYLNFPDTVDMNNTSDAMVDQIVCFPNPVKDVTHLQFRSSDSVKLKLALVDEKGVMHWQYAKKIANRQIITVDVSNRASFPSGHSFRFYYSFSALGSPHYMVGHGDIRICDSADLSQCFQ